ncbi:MAG: hypothetical protein AB9873_12150 [Syntrophobacteraceae bacterium]
MDRSTQWLSLIGGVSLFVYGFVRLLASGEWTLLVISALILAFTASSMMRSRRK